MPFPKTENVDEVRVFRGISGCFGRGGREMRSLVLDMLSSRHHKFRASKQDGNMPGTSSCLLPLGFGTSFFHCSFPRALNEARCLVLNTYLLNELVSKSPKLQTSGKKHDHHKVPFFVFSNFFFLLK